MTRTTTEHVLRVHHWNDSLFSFATTRSPGLRFDSGQFVMIGLEVAGRPLMRAYSIASARYDEELEFFSIKVQRGRLTSLLQNVNAGDSIYVSQKPTGTLLLDDLRAGKDLFLLGTGTGLAPFLSIIKDPETYRRFGKVVLVHGVREISDLAYQQVILEQLPSNELIGQDVRQKLIYYPTVTRQPFRNRGRITDLLQDGERLQAIGVAPLEKMEARFMICGGPSMLRDISAFLNARGYQISPCIGTPGDFVTERAFVEK